MRQHARQHIAAVIINGQPHMWMSGCILRASACMSDICMHGICMHCLASAARLASASMSGICMRQQLDVSFALQPNSFIEACANQFVTVVLDTDVVAVALVARTNRTGVIQASADSFRVRRCWQAGRWGVRSVRRRCAVSRGRAPTLSLLVWSCAAVPFHSQQRCSPPQKFPARGGSVIQAPRQPWWC